MTWRLSERSAYCYCCRRYCCRRCSYLIVVVIYFATTLQVRECSQLHTPGSESSDVTRVLKSNSVTYVHTSDQSFSRSSGIQGKVGKAGGVNDGSWSSRKRRSLPTATETINLVNLHNQLRRQEGAANMDFMTWNVQLASMADIWSQTCIYHHGQPNVPFTPPYNPIGQNIYAITGASLDVLAATNAWYNEKQYYNFSNGACSQGECGHYTQIVWSNSMQVGCGYTTCPTLQMGGGTTWTNAGYFVCNYGPAGNYVGEAPYVKGLNCTQCDSGAAWCNQGLCMNGCTEASATCECSFSCANCGTLNPATCSCQCLPGWTGTDCSTVCENLNPLCGANPGYPLSYCTDPKLESQMKALCPAECGVCQTATGSTPICNTTPSSGNNPKSATTIAAPTTLPIMSHTASDSLRMSGSIQPVPITTITAPAPICTTFNDPTTVECSAARTVTTSLEMFFILSITIVFRLSFAL